MYSNDFLLESMTLNSKEHGRIILKNTTKTLRDGDMLSVMASQSFGVIHFVEVKNKWFSFRVGSFDIAKDTTLTFTLEAPYLGIFVNLEDEFHYAQEGIRSGLIGRNHCGIISLAELNFVCQFRQGHSYAYVDVAFAHWYLQRWHEQFPSLARIVAKIAKGVPVFRTFDASPASGELIAHAGSLRTAVGGQAEVYGNESIDNLMRLLFELHERSLSGILLRPDEEERLRQMRTSLRENLQRKLTLKMLAQETGMNEFKLKAGFKQLFGRPILKYQREERMKAARALLLESDKPVFEIASLVGYRSLSSFSNAFRKQFGYPPSSVR